MNAHIFEVTEAGRVALASECTAPSIGDNHPAALAVHALNNCAQVLRIDPELVTDLELGAATDFLGHACEHVAKLQELLERQERVIEEQRVECLREKRYSARVEEKNSELVQSVLNLTRQLHDAITTKESPRLTAVGGM